MNILFCLDQKTLERKAWVEAARSLSADGVKVGLVTRADNVPEHARGVFAHRTVFSLNDESGQFTTETVTQFASFLTDPQYAETRLQALKLLNRHDMTGSFRLLEREVHFHRMVLQSMQLLSESGTLAVVFEVTPHEFWSFVIWEVAKWRGLKVLFFQPSPLGPSMIPYTSLGEILPVQSRSVFSGPTNEAIRNISRLTLDRLLSLEDPKYMDNQRARDRNSSDRRTRLRALRFVPRWIARPRWPDSVDFTGGEIKPDWLKNMLQVFLSRALFVQLGKSQVKSNAGPAFDQPYCLFALHYEPERSATPEGFPIRFQADAVIALRAKAPPETAVFVKEHYSQTSGALRGFLGRSPLFYGLLDSLSGVSMLSHSGSLKTLLPEAQALFTLTGTAAIEAAILGVPVGYWGTPWWRGLPGTMRVYESTTYMDVCNQKKASVAEIESYLLSLVDRVMVPGICSETRAEIEARVGPLPPHFEEIEKIAVETCVRQLMSVPLGRNR